ncbi:hypothetical protein C8035_v005880 [Colletotrichum spinosum]|uniref:Uncharacterized protein n=1 Tax=Colletotrichum spinosum TaxID=1347390 RepID=A0A4R8PZG2_9PEZI|nr:hypothetical protein C8035_v005880 [Colletotrichum spinosum]
MTRGHRMLPLPGRAEQNEAFDSDPQAVVTTLSPTPTPFSVVSTSSSEASPSWTSAERCKYGRVPVGACNSHYAVDPSLEGNVAFAVPYGLSMAAHLIHGIIHKKVPKLSPWKWSHPSIDRAEIYLNNYLRRFLGNRRLHSTNPQITTSTADWPSSRRTALLLARTAVCSASRQWLSQKSRHG